MPVAAQKTDTDRLRDAESIIARKNQDILLLKRSVAQLHRENDKAEDIRSTIYGLKEMIPDPPEWAVKPQAGHSKTSGVPMTIWSDFHWGEVVEPDQVGGVNKFNRATAIERVKKLVQVTLDLCFKHMTQPKYPGIVICLGGDMITGNIHEELAQTNEGPVQVSILEVQEWLIWGLKIMADHFGKVFVPCVVGNHGRTTLKPRMKNRVFESYEWNLYHQLALYFRNCPEYKNKIAFHIPDETDAFFNVMGHRFMLTHGDTLGVKGGDGIIGAIGPITRGTTKVARSEAQIGRDFDTALICHWHTYIPRGDAGNFIVNGALKGYDEYARLMLRVPYSRPTQALWFMHADHGVTAQWAIYLDKKRKSADSSKWVEWERRDGTRAH